MTATTGLVQRTMGGGGRQRGASLIAAIFILVILAFLGVMMVSLIGTSTLTSVNDLQSGQALYIAEGGKEFIREERTFPNYSTQGAATPLGPGSFTIATPTYLTADPGAAGTTIAVAATAGFPTAGRIVVDTELIDYTGTTPTGFTGAARGAGGTTAAAHASGNAVYPIALLAADITAADATIPVVSTAGFALPGVIKIESEVIYCTGGTAAEFTGCTRGYQGSTAAAHAGGGGGDIAFDAASDTTGNQADNRTWSHTVGAGSDRILIVGVSIRGTESVSRVRYAGADLTLVGSANASDQVRVEFWRMTAPATGTNNIRVDFANQTRFVVGAVSFSGVDQTTPVDAGPIFSSGSIPTAPSRSITTVTDRAWVIDTLAARGSPEPAATVGAGQTQRWNNHINNRITGAGSTEGPASPAGAVTMSWSLAGNNGDDWIIGALALRPAAAAQINVCQYLITATGTVGNAGRVVRAVVDDGGSCGAAGSGGGGGGGNSPAGLPLYPEAGNPDSGNPALDPQAGDSGSAVDGETYSSGDTHFNGENIYFSFYNTTGTTFTFTRFALTGPAGSPTFDKLSYSDFTWNGSNWVNSVSDDTVWNHTLGLPIPSTAFDGGGTISVSPNHRIAMELRFNNDFLPGAYTLTLYDAAGTPYAFTITL